MECWLGQLAQVPDEGPRWSWLYLLILVVFPVINAIKDWFVKRAQGQADQKSKLPTVPTARPAAGELPEAKAVEPQKGAGFRLEPPGVPGAEPVPGPPRRRVTPQMVAKRRAPSPAPGPQPVAQAKPAPPGPAPGRPVGEAKPVTARGPRPQPAAAKVAAAAKATKALADVRLAGSRVDIRTADPGVDIRAADPGVDIREVDPGDVIHEAKPVIEDVLAGPDAAVGPLPVGPVVLGRALTLTDLRRAVILNEIFSRPVSLRGPGGFGAAYRP